MKCQVEKKEKNIVKIIVEVENKEFLEALQRAYFRNAKKFNVPGFRKGKAPKEIIERYYGSEVFFEDAVELVFRARYPEIIKENNIEPIDNPTLEIKQIDRYKDLIFELEVEVKPEVELGQYMGVEIEKVEYTVTDEDVEKELEQVAQKNARVKASEEAIKEGSIVTMSYNGTIDGKEFEGCSVDEYKLTIGSDEFVSDLEEQLIGAKKDDEVKVNITFPENYFKEDLAGKKAVFDVKILRVEEKELPALDDEFAKDVSEFDTLEEYKNSIRERLAADAEERQKDAIEDRVISKAMYNAKVEVPNVMIQRKVESLVEELRHELGHQGVDLETYLKFIGADMESLREQFKEKAEERVRAKLVLEEIIKKENLEITEDEIKEEVENMARARNIEGGNFYKMLGNEQKEYFKYNIAAKKCVKKMVDSAKMLDSEKVADDAKMSE